MAKLLLPMDEGKLQLVGESEIHNGTELTLHKATDGTYQISLLATAGKTSGVAYVHGFIDFNNNGVFDEGEGSDIVETTNSEPGLVTLTWSDIPQSVDTSTTQLGFRVRISSNAADIADATGLAFTGEVEDTTIQQTFPPRGSTSTTTGQKGETQTSQVTFTAYGQIDYDFTTVNTIDTSKVYKLVVDGNEVDDTILTVTGQGTYTLNNTTGEVTFTPEADFVGTATGIVVRALDKNGASTGWTADTATNGLENVQQIQTTYTMDSVYIPTVVAPTISGKDVTSTGLQNVTQTGIPTFTDSISIDGEGTYTIDPSTGVVTFTPVETFTGVATGVTVQLETSVGTDKDGNAVTATATATYTPTVLATTPTIEDVNAAATTVTVGVPTESINMVTSLEVTFPVSTNTDTSSTTTGTTTVTLTKNTDGSYTSTDGNTYTPVDNGDGTVTLTVKVPADADLQATGDGYTTSPITATATDAAGNSTTSSDVITNTPPVITTVTPTTVIEKGSTPLTEAQIAALFDGGSDKKDDASTTDSKTSTVTYVITDSEGNVVTPEQVAANPGDYTVTATITDSDGKSATATALIMTKDTTSPSVAIENVSTAATEVTVTVSDDAEKVDVTFPVSTNTGTTSTTTGTTTVTLTKNTDGSYTGTDGNTYTPVDNGDGTVTLTVKVPAAADLQATGDGYTTSPITATATDAAGNSTTSSDVITNTPPIIETTVPVTTITKGAYY